MINAKNAVLKFSWTSVSIISRLVTEAIGIIQSIVILKLLTAEDWGLIKVVTSAVAMIGVLQNLGISSGATREIAASKGEKEASKVFVGALLIRYFISIPLGLGLIFGANYLGKNFYGEARMVAPFKILGLVLLLQALQSTLNSLIQGLKKFKFLFTYQVAIAVVSLFLNIWLIVTKGFMGYFYAQLLLTLISVIVVGGYSARFIRSKFAIPRPSEMSAIFKNLFVIGISVYFIKILGAQWQNLGTAWLGKINPINEVASFAFAVFLGKKIMNISDAVTDVTLPSMTKVFNDSPEKFNEIFKKNNSKTFALILFSTVLLILTKVQIIELIDYIFSFMGRERIADKYSDSFGLMDPVIIAFWAFAQLNLLKSGVSIPTLHLKDAVFAYLALIFITVVTFFILPFTAIWNYVLSMAVGGISAYGLLVCLQYRSLKLLIFSKIDILYLLLSVVLVVAYELGTPVVLVLPVFLAVSALAFVKTFGCGGGS